MSPREKKELREQTGELRSKLVLAKARIAQLGLGETANYLALALQAMHTETKNKTGGES